MHYRGRTAPLHAYPQRVVSPARRESHPIRYTAQHRIASPARRERFNKPRVVSRHLALRSHHLPPPHPRRHRRGRNDRKHVHFDPRHRKGAPLQREHKKTTLPVSRLSGKLRSGSFQYKPLKGSQIRLLELLPATKTLIKCKLSHVDLASARPYTAVSYAWGDAGDTRDIELDGCRIPVAVSLHGALDAIRYRDRSRFVWADALCLNQQDADEKAQQIQLMARIYRTAKSVAIWLGPGEHESARAVNLLYALARREQSRQRVFQILSSRSGQRDLRAVVSLFERSYWDRLWVVQEVLVAKSTTVYCGYTKVPWSIYMDAADVFVRYNHYLQYYVPEHKSPARRGNGPLSRFSPSQVLVHQGPNSLVDLQIPDNSTAEVLLDVLRACRRKIASNPRDKLYGVLSILPRAVRQEFRADYNLTIKEVYTEIVDYLFKTTRCVDVICDAIHFPSYTGTADLPSYVPDWSHIPQISSIGSMGHFTASGRSHAQCSFVDARFNKLELHAIYLDTISVHGSSVGTSCVLVDYLMSFLNWRTLLMGHLEGSHEPHKRFAIEQDFCHVLSLGQRHPGYDTARQHLGICYHVFASLLHERMPQLLRGSDLQYYIKAHGVMRPKYPRTLLQEYFGNKMMGRRFCMTKKHRLGLGSGAMSQGDIIVIPLGCSTPIILRRDGTHGEYRFVGDVYIHGYMHGKAFEQLQSGTRHLRKYVLN